MIGSPLTVDHDREPAMTPPSSPSSPSSSLQQEPLGDRVAHELRVLIITGTLAPGTHLVEGPLAEQFDVSRGPVRDALKRLEAEGLVESRRRGVFVKGLSAEDVDELYSLREALEAMALRLAMERAGADDWQRAEQHLTQMRAAADAADARAFARADLEFHGQFYALSGHRRLAAVWEQYRPTFAVMLGVTNAQDRDLHPSAEAHADLLEAIRAKRGELTASLLSEHLLGSCNRLRGALQVAVWRQADRAAHENEAG
jgi:GntR family transcriptional regulator, gluconate operon transcriptional repressor